MALGLVLASLWAQSPVPGVTAFWGCRLVQAQLSPWTHWDPLEPGTATPEGARGGTWLKVKCTSVCQSPRVRPCLGRQTERPLSKEAFLQPKKKLRRPHPSHLRFQRRKPGGLGCRRNLLTRSGWWAAGLPGPGPGLCLWRPLGGCSPRVWPANSGWCLAGYQGHRCGSFPMQIHR